MKDYNKARISIGTSNIVVPGNKKSFPEEFRDKSRLRYYSSLFNTLEVNSSFYKIPMKSTCEKWAADVPEDFTFSFKLWREITHIKNLDFNTDHIAQFLNAADGIGKKKGGLLLQFPGKIDFSYYSKVEKLLCKIAEADSKRSWQVAVEFRNADWYVAETNELLDEYNASIVLHDIPKGKNTAVNKNAKLIFVRYHGPTGDYRGSYEDLFLQEQAKQLLDWQQAGKNVYAYFNNTIGNAFENARQLSGLVNV